MESLEAPLTVRFNRSLLAERLLRRNVSFAGFARLAGMNPSYVSRLLSGHRHPSPETREKLLNGCLKLGTPELKFDDLFTIVERDR